MAWQWEGDWQIETTLDGQPLDHDVNMIIFIFNLFCFVNLIFDNTIDNTIIFI